MDKKSTVLQITQELSGQWNVPILLVLEDCGGRFTPLQRELGIAPARLSDNLRRMAQVGLIEQISANERHHPLFPEYVMTEKGRLYREAATTIQVAENHIGSGRLSAKAWNIPVLLSLDFDYHRFQEIRLALHQVTPRMLSLRLNELTEDGIVGKQVSEHPRPSFVYHLSQHAKKPVHQLSVNLCALL